MCFACNYHVCSGNDNFLRDLACEPEQQPPVMMDPDFPADFPRHSLNSMTVARPLIFSNDVTVSNDVPRTLSNFNNNNAARFQPSFLATSRHSR